MSKGNPRIRGLYAITPDEADTDRLLMMVAAALEGGAMLVQYRNKVADQALRAHQAMLLSTLCGKYRRPLIVNDHAELAIGIEGAGLHVGAHDVSVDHAGDLRALRELRERLGPTRILGVSCYASLDRAKEAVAAGADYVAFGSVFPSPTKPAAARAPLTLFAKARALNVAVVGIGGIAASNLPRLIDAGADAAAVITDLFDVSDSSEQVHAADIASIRARAAALAGCFAHGLARGLDSRTARPDPILKIRSS